MPVWIQYVLAASALVAAIGVIWGKVLKPALRFFNTAEEMLPLLQKLTAEFKGTPDAFKVLGEIADQFRTNSGSSLKDQVNRLEAAAERQEANAEHLKIGVESQRKLAEQDRAELRELLISMTRLDVKVEAGAATSTRIEEAATGSVADAAAQIDKQSEK